jgi:very-short-patch-repair endonuclease
VSDDLAELLELQHGILTVHQAEESGLSRQSVTYRVLQGRWQRVHPGVYANSAAALDAEQRIWAGMLYAGLGAYLGFRTAWWLADRQLSEPEVIDIVVPDPRIVRKQPGLRIHRTRRWDERDLQPTALPRRFRLERAVLDCASAAASPAQAVAQLASAVQRRTTTVPRLKEVLGRCPNLPRHALLSEVLDLAADGAETLLEVRHHHITTSHGLPAPQRQRRLGDALVDSLYDCPDGSQLVTELDGKQGHFDTPGWWADMARDNQHTVNRLGVLRFPGFVLLTDPHQVAATIAAALTTRGWTGTLRCPRSCPGPRNS